MMSPLISQVEAIPYYQGINFNSHFCIKAENDNRANYFVVDLSHFNTSFEKAYFQELTYRESRIVRIDSGNQNIAWFKSHNSNTSSEISDLLNSLKTQTLTVTSSMSDSDKQAWLNRNGK
jgi:hypothetical protein